MDTFQSICQLFIGFDLFCRDIFDIKKLVDTFNNQVHVEPDILYSGILACYRIVRGVDGY